MLVLRVFACLFLLLIVSPVSGQENGRPALPDNLHVITAANANRLEEVARLGTGSVDNLIWSPNNRYVAAFGASGVWLFKSDDISEPILHLQNHSESVEYAVFSPDSSLIATGGEDVVIVTIVATGETLHTLEAAMGFAAFTPDGLWLVTDSHLEYDSPIVWSVTTGEMLTRLNRHQLAHFTGMAFSQDGTQMAGVYQSRRWGYMNVIKVWDTLTWNKLLQIPTAGKWIHSISFSASDAQLVACTENESLAWELEDGHLAQTGYENIRCQLDDDSQLEALNAFGIQLEEVQSSVVSPDRSRIGFIDADGHLQIGTRSNLKRQISTFAFSSRFINTLAFSPNGQLLAALENQYRNTTNVRLWNLATTPISTFATFTLDDDYAYSSHLTFLANDQLLIYSARSGQVGIWSTETEEFVSQFQIKIEGQGVLAVGSDLSSIAYVNWQFDASDSPLLHMQTWDIASGSMLSVFSNLGSYENVTPVVWKASFSPDGYFIASAGRNAHLWNARTGEEVAVFYDYTFPEGQWEIDDVVFSPDGHFLVADTKERNSQIYVWDVQRAIETYPLTIQNPLTNTGSLVSLLCHVSASLSFSPDGELLISGAQESFWGGDSTIKLWNTSNWQEIVTLQGHIDGVSSLDITSNGALLASAGADGTIRLWGVKE